MNNYHRSLKETYFDYLKNREWYLVHTNFILAHGRSMRFSINERRFRGLLTISLCVSPFSYRIWFYFMVLVESFANLSSDTFK